jgi:hypothetical protein
MKFENIVESNDFTTALQGARAALEQLGYRLEADQSGTWIYKRGNFWGALLATSPKGWRSTVVLEKVPSGLGLKMIVDTSGKIELPAAVRYWEKEVSHINASASGEQPEVKDVKFKRPPILIPMMLSMGVAGVFIGAGSYLAVVLQQPLILYASSGLGLFLAKQIIFSMTMK